MISRRNIVAWLASVSVVAIPAVLHSHFPIEINNERETIGPAIPAPPPYELRTFTRPYRDPSQVYLELVERIRNE